MKKRIISLVTHTPHQYDVANALYDWQMDLLGNGWEKQQRPIPPNVSFVNDFNPDNYDVAISHVGGETEAIAVDRFEGKLPIILISHGVGEPYMTGDPNTPYDSHKIAKSCKDYKVVCCCEKEAKYWETVGVKNATFIWHGMKEEFGQCLYDEKKPLIVNSGGWEYSNNVSLLSELNKRGIPWLQRDFSIGNFEDYKNTLSKFNVYISGTRNSSFPRSRAEAMHTGMCVLTTHNWDEDQFIREKENGLFIEDNPDAIMAAIDNLDLETIQKIGQSGQKTARDVFGVEAYRKRWLEEIRSIIKKI